MLLRRGHMDERSAGGNRKWRGDDLGSLDEDLASGAWTGDSSETCRDGQVHPARGAKKGDGSKITQIR